MVARTPSAHLLPVPLYHGTSTLFLESILDLGLGAKDPLAELELHGAIREILPLVERDLSGTEAFMSKIGSFRLMAEQASRSMNFQHGQTYLSPSRDTAARYAINSRYGSEILTYTLDFLKELADRDVPSVRTELFQKYRKLFNLLDVSPAPLLLRIESASISELLDEHGGDPANAVQQVNEMLIEFPDCTEEMLQQTNFRLKAPIEASRLRVCLINVLQWHFIAPKYKLYEVVVPAESSGGA